MEYHVYWLLKSSCSELLRDGKYGLFSSQKVDGKMIFTYYWKVLVLTFLEMGNTGFFSSQKVDGKMIFIDYWKVLVLSFSVMGNTVFFSAKKLMERWHLLGLFELSMIFQVLGTMVFRAVYITFKMCWLPYIFLVCYKWNCPAFLCVNVTQIPCVVSRLLLRENFTSFIFCVSCHTFLPDFLCRHSTCHTSFSHFWWMSQVCWYRFLPFM